eukprot:2285564-Rhodomonas_salina.2
MRCPPCIYAPAMQCPILTERVCYQESFVRPVVEDAPSAANEVIPALLEGQASCPGSVRDGWCR